MSIFDLVAEFKRLDGQGADGYVGHDSVDEWPTVGFEAGGTGYAVMSIHPDDIVVAVEVLRKFSDGAANARGSDGLTYDPQKSLQNSGVRFRWHI